MPSSSSASRIAEPDHPQVAWHQGLTALLCAFIAVKLALLVVLTWNTKYVMDEYWLVGRVWLFDTNLYQDVFPAKTLLYAAFYQFAHWLGEGAVQVMQIARLQAVGVSILGLGLLYGVARNIGWNRLESLFALCAVLAFSSYMERAFMTRPEAPATFLALAALWIVTREGGGLRKVFIAGLLSGLAFLTMQKSVYFNLALGLALVGDGLARRSLREAFLAGAVLVLGWALMLLVYWAYFAAAGAVFSDVLTQVLTGSTGNALRGHQAYGNLRGYIGQTLTQNPVQYLLCVAGWLLVRPRFFKASRAERTAWIFTGVIATLIFFHPAPWPYNFIMSIPFLGLWAPQVVRLAAGQGSMRPALVLGGLLFVLAFSVTRNVSYLDNHNGLQNDTVRRAEALLGPADTYADGIGMVVTRRRAGRQDWWARFGILRILDSARQGDFESIDAVFADSPKIWILNYRTDALAEVLAPYFANAYVAIFPNILIAGAELTSEHAVTFQAYWPGEYRLYQADGTPTDASSFVLDGRRGSGIVQIDKGEHSVQMLAEEGPLYLLPADVSLAFDLTQSPERQPLFDNVYTF